MMGLREWLHRVSAPPCLHPLWTPWRTVGDSVYEGPLCKERQCLSCQFYQVAPMDYEVVGDIAYPIPVALGRALTEIEGSQLVVSRQDESNYESFGFRAVFIYGDTKERVTEEYHDSLEGALAAVGVRVARDAVHRV